MFVLARVERPSTSLLLVISFPLFCSIPGKGSRPSPSPLSVPSLKKMMCLQKGLTNLCFLARDPKTAD